MPRSSGKPAMASSDAGHGSVLDPAMADNHPASPLSGYPGLQRFQADVGVAAASESSSGASSGPSTPVGPSFWPANAAATQSLVPIVKPKKKRRRDRNRPIHEIHRLQTQVEQMEAKLQTLRANAPPDSSEVQELKSKNEDLKQRLQRSLQRTTAVEQLLQTQTDKLLQALPQSLAVSGENLVYDVVEDDAVFQELARTVDEHYLDMDRVFGAAGLNDEMAEIFDAYVTPVREKSDCDGVLKTRTCTYLPYASELVEQAMWSRMQSETAILPCNVQSCEDLGLPLGLAANLIVSKREVHLDNASFTIRLALKEFVEPDRLVYVWDAVGDWPRADSVPHISTREYGWSYFMQTDSPDLSILRSVVLVTSRAAPSADAKLVERVMQLYRHTIEARYQKLENTLVDASICARKSTSEVEAS